VNLITGDILSCLEDSDLALIMSDTSDRRKILKGIRDYQQRTLDGSSEERAVALRVKEWMRENEEEEEREG
jgi:hypothetical protein